MSLTTPSNVHSVLQKHMLVDGYDVVLDLEKSQGSYLFDAKSGKKYLDFFTFFASNPIGFNHPKLLNHPVLADRLRKVAFHNPSNSDIYTSEMADFVDTFARVGIPKHLPYLFLVAGGALAVENALKVAFDWKVQKNFQKGYRTEKGQKVLHFDKAFHGRSGYTLSLTNTEPNKIKYFPKFDWPRISSPAMRFPVTAENTKLVVDDELVALAQAERYFELYKDDIACIIVEPIQGEGGDRHFRNEFHLALRKMADKHEALLIYDEVQTGVGITGKFWAHQHYVNPDIIAFGKKAQVCGILASKKLDEIDNHCFKTSSRINSTWGGNLIDMVRFQGILEIIEEDNLVQNSAMVGEYLLNQLQKLGKDYEHITNARGKGLMCAFDLPDAHSRKAFLDESFKAGLMILPCGTNSIRFRPPLNVTKEQINEGLGIVESSYKKALERCPVNGVSKVKATKSEAKTE